MNLYIVVTLKGGVSSKLEVGEKPWRCYGYLNDCSDTAPDLCDSDCCDADCYHVFKYQGHVNGFCAQIEGTPDSKCKCWFDC